MLDIMEFMLAPFVACMLLIIINSYFGIHVLKREVIFIDIALAQIAAFGATVAVVADGVFHDHAGHNHDEHTIMPYLFSLAFTSIAALVFTFLKNNKLRIPLEGLIGIAYAVATTAAVIFLDKGAGSDVHVHDMLVGSILWVTWKQILFLFIIVVLVGGFHYIFRDKFLRLSDKYLNEDNTAKGNKLWDFLFYFTFGIAVVQSVSIAGIIVVFAFLIIPASISALFSDNWKTRILLGWGLGTLITIGGLITSWKMDVPSGPAVIIFLGIFLLIAVAVKALNIFKVPQEKGTG